MTMTQQQIDLTLKLDALAGAPTDRQMLTYPTFAFSVAVQQANRLLRAAGLTESEARIAYPTEPGGYCRVLATVAETEAELDIALRTSNIDAFMLAGNAVDKLREEMSDDLSWWVDEASTFLIELQRVLS